MAAVFPSITQRESIVEATVYLKTSFQKSHSIISAIPLPPAPGDPQDILTDVSAPTQDTNTWRQDPEAGCQTSPVARPDDCLSVLLSLPMMLSLLVLRLPLLFLLLISPLPSVQGFHNGIFQAGAFP